MLEFINWTQNHSEQEPVPTLCNGNKRSGSSSPEPLSKKPRLATDEVDPETDAIADLQDDEMFNLESVNNGELSLVLEIISTDYINAKKQLSFLALCERL